MLDKPSAILTTDSSDAERLKYRLFGDSTAPQAVVYINGLESHGEWFTAAADFLATRGYAVYLWDRRGSGLNENNRGDCKSYQQFVDDLALFITEKRRTHTRIHLVGHSWGGKFATYFAIRRQHLIDSLTLITPGLAPRASYSLPGKIGIAKSILINRAKYYPTPLTAEQFTSRPEALDYIRHDPLRLRHITAGFIFENMKMDAFIKKNADGVRVPTALFLAGDDTVIDNEKTESIFERFHPHASRVRVWEDSRHCLLFERRDELNDELADWLDKCLKYTVGPKKIMIAGAGSVGCVVGGTLAMAGHDVTLLARPRHTNAVKKNGLRLTLFGRDITAKNIKAVTAPAQAEAPEIVIICVKSFDTAELLKSLRPLIGPQTVFLSLQNGVGNEDAIRRAFPHNPVAGGVILGYFSMPGDGHCATTHDRGGILMAAHSGLNARSLEELADTLRDSRMIVRTAENFSGVKWSKLLLNSAFNALSAVTDLPAEKLLGHPKLFALNRLLFRECLAVMRKLDIPVYNLPGYSVRSLARASAVPTFIAQRFRKLAGSEQGGRSSMWYDVTSGRGRTEIDYLNGIIVEEGEKNGVPTPASRHIVNIVREISGDEAARKQYAANLKLIYSVPKK